MERHNDGPGSITRRDFLKVGATAGVGGVLATGTTGGVSAQGTGGAPTNAAISVPRGGGAIRSIGETFQAAPFTGTGNFSVPIFTSPGRSGFGPQLTLQYSTGHGNGPFGLGWQLSVPQISRKT